MIDKRFVCPFRARFEGGSRSIWFFWLGVSCSGGQAISFKPSLASPGKGRDLSRKLLLVGSGIRGHKKLLICYAPSEVKNPYFFESCAEKNIIFFKLRSGTKPQSGCAGPKSSKISNFRPVSDSKFRKSHFLISLSSVHIDENWSTLTFYRSDTAGTGIRIPFRISKNKICSNFVYPTKFELLTKTMFFWKLGFLCPRIPFSHHIWADFQCCCWWSAWKIRNRQCLDQFFESNSHSSKHWSCYDSKGGDLGTPMSMISCED